MARDPEMPGCFRLRQVVMRGDTPPQGLPIQLVGGVRPRSLVRQTTGLSHRYTLASPTLNLRAASALLPPSRTKLTTRMRKSDERLMPSFFQSATHLSISNCGLSYKPSAVHMRSETDIAIFVCDNIN